MPSQGKEENFLSSWLREDVEGKEEEREKLNMEVKKKREVKVGKERGGGRKGKGKIICPNRLSSKVFEVLCPVSEVESVGNSLSFSVCVPVVSPFVPVVIALFSNVTVVCEVVFL